ncbi:hypothetical protein AWC38_SpisGene9031 [Stylophora pistillata]|uniref:Uncharacterized protein n=1 Tax=Stylophora pistillata TaxID=50429 RepID=A0A2B4SCY1_STYPI|nr:hypothetical protein AWC38_SpisGene9031 [Stylophora pistillata]
MFGWSPPNILATLVLFHSLLLHLKLSPIQAKPYPQRDLLSTYTTGNLGGLNEGDWPDYINYKNGDYIERDKRSPTEVEDRLPNSRYEQSLTVEPRKRQGIETPIQPLTSDSRLDKDTLSHLNTEENVRSKVDQPDSESIGVPVEEERKVSNNKAIDSSVADHRQESMEKPDSNKQKTEKLLKGEDSSSKDNGNNVQKQQGESEEIKTENNGKNDKADSNSESINSTESFAEKNSANVQESETTASAVVDENAQVRSVQHNADTTKKLENLPNDKNVVKFPGSLSQSGNSVADAVIAGKQASPQEAQTLTKDSVNKQVSGDETKGSSDKLETQDTTIKSRNQNTAASGLGSKDNFSSKTQSSPQESEAAIHTVPQIQNAPVGPVRDALGNSGSEIVTTRGASDLDSYADRDGEQKQSNGPEVGHFQVDDKSADLEINANSAGVKVKAKPASLQVVSRPGSHSASAAAQERSFYHHYHYPPYHLHHHWYPGMRRSYGHFHRRNFYHPYNSFPERRGFESFYDEAPFYRRHLHYWYPHHHRHHFRDSYLYERSRMEQPEDFPEHHSRRRHKRRFRHLNGPYRRQYYNNIPIMNGMESPQMNMMPEEGTMPQLPIGGGMPFTQRQNIISPMPPPINVDGNPPPGLLGGMNAQNFMLNGMNGLNNLNGANQINNMNAFRGINDMSNIGTAGLNSLEPMGAMESLPGGINGGMQGMAPTSEIPVGSLGTRNVNSPPEAPRMAFKKTKILSSKKNNESETNNHDARKAPLNKQHDAGKANKGKVNIESWEKTLKRYHRLNVFTSKKHERHQYRRNAKLDGKNTDKKDTKKHHLLHPHAQHPKEVKGSRKNSIVMHRPPIIYHPPPEIYHRPDIVVHRAPIMLHRPPIIYHQPPVVVHRPAIIYHQPPIVFHQPPPVVHQPILHSHDTWVAKPVVYHTASMVSHAKTYYGVPSHVYAGDFGGGCHGAHCSYRKGKVPHQAKNSTQPDKFKKTKRDSLSDYVAYFTSLWKPKVLTKREIDDQYDFITSTEGSKEKLSYKNMDVDVVNKRDTSSEHINGNLKFRRETEQDDRDDSKGGTQKKKKKDVVVNRPPIIYHPPPEIYHRPDIVVHRPPLVIHRPPIIYHQPPVIVHRPAVVYHQPPIVFHQPPPAVSQPLLYSHDSFTVHPSFYATHHGSVVRDFGHYVGVPNVITNYGNPLFGRPPPIGKRSKIEGSSTSENATVADSKNITTAASKRTSFEDNAKKAKNETNEKAGKKNTVIVRRPPIIYHPPPEIYHRPIIVVHRPPIMIHRAPIFYHQPPVVVHRPAIVYHQPPLVFHQPPPMVHQPVLKSHDTWISHPVVVPYSSRVLHHHTYVGVPDAYTVHHFGGGHGYSFYKSHILKHSKSLEEEASARNKISGDTNSTKLEEDSSHKTLHSRKENVTSKLTTKKAKSQKGRKKNAVIVRRPPVIYHPPPEIYHRPEIVVHRAPIVIHRAPIIYHQPPVIVHRPAIVYHQPALIFHQPPPVVHQPVFRSHDTYVHRPLVRLYGSRMHHVGHLYHIPHAYYHGHGGGVHYMAYGKSKVPAKEKTEEEKGETRATVKGKRGHRKSKSKKTGAPSGRKHIPLTRSKDKTETGTKLHKSHGLQVKYHEAKEVTEKANKKNSVVIHRPPIIYHPPPEIYHRPDIVVHRAPIMLYRAPIIYHQPPVVVHRPAIVYHQPPIVFHQPPPMVHQPVLHSHDTWVTKPVVIPYASHVRHVATYKGVPHEEIFMHGIGTGAFGKSHVPMKATRRDKVHRIEENDQDSAEKTKTTTELNKPSNETQSTKTKHADDTKQNEKNSTKLGAGERIARALSDSLIHKQWETRSPVGAQTRIQRSLHSLLPYFSDPIESRYSSEFSLFPQRHNVISGEVPTRIQRSIDDVWNPYTKPLISSVDSRMGPSARIQRALADPRTTFEGETAYEMYKRSSEENQNSTPDENADKNTNSTKKTLLIIRRPPILFHPPSHMIHRPSIVVHRPDIIVHRHPIVFHRPPILVHRPPIIIHRQPVLIHRPPIIVHRPPLVFHRPPIIIHRRPYIIHHHPILFHRPPIIIHKGPQMIVHHSHLIHHYPMHMIHMHCPGCGYGKSTVARLEDNSSEHDIMKTSQSDRSHKDATNVDSKGKSSNKPKRSVADKKSKKSSGETNHHRKRKESRKKKKDVVVNRPPIIYHPPPEVYHRPDIVVHRAPILIHRPPIVYHQPPVVVHRPAVVYHQPPIVFHQPAPAVNQPVLYSHDSFVVHPMAFASHMGSVVNDAGHYVGLPHGGVTNYPGNILHGPTGHMFPTLNQAHWARRTEVSKPQRAKPLKVRDKKHQQHQKRTSELKEDEHGHLREAQSTPTRQKSKHTKGERKNKVIVARPPMIYHPPPEIYDRPDIVVHRPDIVIHRPSIVYHQPSVVVHRAPVVYQQPPVVFHQPSPMVSQPIYHAHDTYLAHPVFHPQVSHIAHSSTYVGAPHLYPGHNDYGWGLSGHLPAVQTPQYHYASNYGYYGIHGYTPSPAYGAYGYSSYGPAFGRSEVENSTTKSLKKEDERKHFKGSLPNKNVSRKRRSAEMSKRHFHHHHRHHHHHSQHHRHSHHHRGTKRFYHLRPISAFSHSGHRKHVIIIHRPPLIYHPAPQVYRQPDILMHLPPLVYNRPAIMFQQPPTIVHHPPIIYHQPPVVFHNPPPIIHTPVIHSHEIFTPHAQNIMLPTSSYLHRSGNYLGSVLQGAAYGKSNIERVETSSSKIESETKEKGEVQKTKPNEKREAIHLGRAKLLNNEKAKKQNVGVVVHQPPIVYHPPPDIFDKPTVVMHPPPLIVHRPPILIHRAPVVVHRPPVIIHRPPIVLHHPTPVYHVAQGHLFNPMRFAFGKSSIEKDNSTVSKENLTGKGEYIAKSTKPKGIKEKSQDNKGERKNLVVVHRPPMIYHPPPEIYDRPDVIMHRPDIVVHRPSIVYHQPSVVVHRPPIIYRQPPIVFHQPPPMIHQPIMHAHDTYLAHPVPVPYTSQIHHTATYVGAPHYFHHQPFGDFIGHAFGKSAVEKVENKNTTKDEKFIQKKTSKAGEKSHSKSRRDIRDKYEPKAKSSEQSKGHKKNKVIIARPPMIYHPPPEIYDRPNIIVHRPDIVIHRPSIVYHQSSVVVHRPPVIYQQPPVVFHQPPPLVRQPIMHAHDTYVAHPVPVPYSSHIQHTSTYVGSPHHYPGGWNYGWSQPQFFSPAFGKSKVPKTNSKPLKGQKAKESQKDKIKRAAKDDQSKNFKAIKPKSERASKKKNQVVIQRPLLIYHPPPEVYHKPDVVMHRPDIVIHRPPVVYHQPSVVVHRPPVVYQQPPVVFHQPSPTVSQPIFHARDTYLPHPYFTPYATSMSTSGNYVGTPHFYGSGWGMGGDMYGFHSAFGKSNVAKAHKKQKNVKQEDKRVDKGSKRTLEQEAKSAEDKLRLKNETKTTIKGNKKNLVIMRRPPLIYHPPPEVYHKPDVIMHRPDIVIHRPSIVFHQPSVVVHRPPVIYHQPPVVFHQPSPMVHQPIFHSHDTYLAHPHFVPFTSHVYHSHSYVGAPHFYPGDWGWERHHYGYGFHHAFGKSKVEKARKKHNKSKTIEHEESRRTLHETEARKTNEKERGDNSKVHKKNLVVMRRPPLIYHPPPEIYHRPDIVVHRPDLVIHRPSVVFHQPSVVVHRPPVIYHQPPVVFHQPSPMVHQPIFHAHETYLAHPHFVPFMSHLAHAGSYVGAPHFYPGHFGHGIGHFMGHAFYKSKVEKGSKKGSVRTIEKGKKGNEVSHSKEALRSKFKRDTSKPSKTLKSHSKSKLLTHIIKGGTQGANIKKLSENAKTKSVPLHPQKEDKKRHRKGHKKNMVVIQRPTLIYHPPPEIYDRPDIIVHRPDFVIHQPSVVYHQPSVVVHRPPVIYNPPPVVFHQPPPTVHQPMYTAHDMYRSHPSFVPYSSHIKHTHTYVGAPHYYAGGWRANYIAPTIPANRRVLPRPNPVAFSKSHVEKHTDKYQELSKTHEKSREGKHITSLHHSIKKAGVRKPRSIESNRIVTTTYHSLKNKLHKKGHQNGKGGKKNQVVIRRPPLVYHPPPEVYHRPDIIVHRPDIVLHQPSVVYHQPSVVVHRPPVIYRQPPVVFHQPAPMERRKGNILHPQEAKDEKASRKNDIVVSRPPIIYHPPPEIYHRPDIVVHRAPIVLHRPPIIYHQPPVVVHRPAVVYHQPPIVFHQPPPAVNQPILHSHDSFILRPAARFLPQGSTVTHSMSYVGIPNHVIHGDELDFHHFHRSHIERSSKGKFNWKSSKPQIAKSTISKTPTTKTENTETIITDQTQKKTLRSTINHHPLTKRQFMGSHPLYGPVSPINDVEDLYKSIEQKEKMSIIPGNTSIREHEVAKRSHKPSHHMTKRQLILPESAGSVYHNSIPSVYNQLETAALQNQALMEEQGIPNPDGINIEHLPGFAANLKAIQELEGAPVAASRFSIPLQQYLPAAPKDDPPDVRVHVETAKSSIPLRKRGKRQLVPLYQQQGPVIPRFLYQAQNPGSVGVIHSPAPSSLYNLFNAYHPAYHTIPNPLSYLSMVPQLPHRPHVNINVQSARSAIPVHVLQKRSKRQLLALTPPVPRVMPVGFDGTGLIRNYPTYSPFAAISRFSLPLLTNFKYADDSVPSEPGYPEVLPLFHQYPKQLHRLYNTLSQDGSSDSPPINPWASYLAALYSSFLGYPLYHRHHKPKVRVEVQASKSHIPKVLKTENKHTVHSRAPITKRQLLNYIPESSFTAGHFTLPPALNYGMQGIPLQRSPRVNINVETTKKNRIPAVKESKGSTKRGNIKHRQVNKTGDKRDEMIDGEKNGADMFQNRGNPDFANNPENQFVATSETAGSEEEPTSNNEGQPQSQSENFQQQSEEEAVGQRQDLQQNSEQQLLPSQDQPVMEQTTSQPQALRAYNVPLQLPVQQPLQSAFQVPFQAPFVVPFQGRLPNALPVAPAIPVAEQPSSQQETEPEVVQPKHTSISVNVAEKSTVPKKRSKKRKHPLHKRQFLPVTQGYVPAYRVPIPYNSNAPLPDQKRPRVSISVQTARRSTAQQPHNKRQSISLLTRFPAMQVLPQTFKQNGIMMPAFNTLPINHKLKANGMLIEELQRKKKNKIQEASRGFKTGKSGQIMQKAKLSTPLKMSWYRRRENAKKRQFFAVPQSLSAFQRYPLLLRPKLHPRPRVSVNVEVSKRKFDFQKGKTQSKSVKSNPEETDGRIFDKSARKRQVYGIDHLRQMVHLPVVGAPILTQSPVANQRPRVSIHVETAKKKNRLSRKIDHRKEAERKGKRQIYGLSELPHEGLPVTIAGQGQALNRYFPNTEHDPHVSVNVEASKRSDDDDDMMHKRQVFLQPVEQDQEQVAMTNGDESSQSQEPNQVGVIQSPTPEKEQLHSLPTLIQSNSGVTEPQQVEELSQSEALPSQAGLSETDNERPRISVHVESSKRSQYERQRKVNGVIGPKLRTAPWKGSKRQLQRQDLQREDYEPEQETTAANLGDLLQDQRPRVSVDVNVAKKKHTVTGTSSLKKRKYHGHTAKASNPARRQITVPFGGGINAIQVDPNQNTQFMIGKDRNENGQGAQEAPMSFQSQLQVPDEQQQQQQQPTQQIMQPVAILQPDQQQFPALQRAIMPDANTVEEKTRPKVSISVQTAKSSISKRKDHARDSHSLNEPQVKQKLRRQLFGTVPLLSSLGQSTLNGASKENKRSGEPLSTRETPSHIQDGDRLWKRQLFNYLGGQQEPQFVPTQSLQSSSDTQQQGQALQIQPIQAMPQDDGAQLSSFNLPQASLIQTSDQGSLQTYPTQVEAPGSTEQASTTAIQPVESSNNLDRPFQRPHVSINVQTAKSQVPNPRKLFHDHALKDNAVNSKHNTGKGQERKKFKRQLDILGGGMIERRRGPKLLGGLKKPRPENLFGLGNNLNKPVEVFTDPISNLIGGGAGRKRPKLGGIRLESPTGVGALPLKGAAAALESALPPELGVSNTLQDSPTEAVAPFTQETRIANEPLFRPPSGIAGPQLDALEREGDRANDVPLNDLPSMRPAVLPLPSINRVFLPNLEVPQAAPPQVNPLLLTPRVLPIGPILPIASPAPLPPPVEETEPTEVPQAPPRFAPLLPPIFPLPGPSIAPNPALTAPDSLLPEPEDDKPSVHVNVETSRSSVPETGRHSKQHANSPAKRG